MEILTTPFDDFSSFNILKLGHILAFVLMVFETLLMSNKNYLDWY